MTGRLIDARLAELRPHPQNYNRHSEEQIGRLAQSLETFGQPKPIVIWRGLIIAGHGLAQAAQRLGWERLQASDMSEEWTEQQALAFMAADNELARLGDPDEAALAALAASLADVDRELAALAAGTEERLAELLKTLATPAGDDPGAQVDKAAELQAKWQTATGQLWQLGEHRLICGDCTDRAVVERLGKVDYLFTDPPYGIDIDTSWLTALHVQRGKPANLSDDKLAGDDGTLDLSWLWQYDQRMVWGFPYIFDHQATGWIVWDKQPGVEDRGIVTPIEMASTTMRKGFDMVRVMWGGYYRAAGEDRQPHPTQKPVGVVAPFIEMWTKPSEIILDPFLGSGTTLIACERLGRRCRAVEIEPGYVAVALERWATMTGKTPVLVGGGSDGLDGLDG